MRIELKGVGKRFGESVAVEKVDLGMRAGELVVLLGPSGCGKTTTLRMIAGLEEPSEGEVWIGGREVTRMRPGERDIAFVFQMFALYPHMTVEANVGFPLRAAGVEKGEVRRRVDAVLKRLGLEGLRKRRPGKLSGGDQQRVSLARAMVREPAAFLMDEPMGTLDAEQRERTRGELRAIHNEMAAKSGATTVLVTHDQTEAMGMADRIVVMDRGRVLQVGTPREVYEWPGDLFVANFIGSPGMNLMEGGVASGQLPVVRGEGTGGSLEVQKGVGEGLVMGVRPEYVRVGGETGADGVVEHTEVLGAYNLVEVRIGGEGGKVIKARVGAKERYAEGARVKVRFEESGVRWFEKGTGKAVRVR